MTTFSCPFNYAFNQEIRIGDNWFWRSELLTGKRFRLKFATLGLTLVGEKRVAVPIPAESIVEVTGGPRPNDRRMVDVLWEAQALVMFAEDLQERGEEVTVKKTGAE